MRTRARKRQERRDGSERREKKTTEEERRERKEGVRVRVRLGVGGAIRNYCGTIDKRRLRGRTTEDSLRPSDFSSLPTSSLFLSSLFLTRPSWTSASCRALPTKPSRLVNM